MGRRLSRQHLLEPVPDPVATASRLGGVHAQVASGTALIVGIRTTDFAPTAIDDALWQRRSLVKTWGMRGTLHLFPADELPTWVAAFRQRQWPRFTPAWEKYHGVTPDDLRRITEAVGQVLPGRVLTREELATEIAALLGAPELAERIRSGWGVMLKPAAGRWSALFRAGPGAQRDLHRPAQLAPGRPLGRDRPRHRDARDRLPVSRYLWACRSRGLRPLVGNRRRIGPQDLRRPQ
jgi:hypothetical protein